MRIVKGSALAALVLGTIGLIGGVRDAAAQEPWRGVPTFATLDRGDGDSLAGVGLGLSLWDGDSGVERALRIELHGQYVARSGFGGYAALPLSNAAFEGILGGDGESGTGVGNLELGGLWVTPQHPSFSVVLRGGLALPTASDDGVEVLANFANLYPRLTDAALAFPNTTWIRLAASPVVRSGVVFLRADVGLDVPIADDDGADDPLLRVNLGVGVDPGPAAFTAELVTVANTDGLGNGEEDEDFVHTFTLSARYIGGPAQPYVAIGVPLDESIREAVSAFVIAGVQGLF